MKFFYEVISTPTADTPGTVVNLHFPDKRYFFGQISEGVQRACIERGVKLTYLSDIFITGRTEWANLGGLIGVILTLADSTSSSAAALEDDIRKKAERKQMSRAEGKTQLEKAAPHYHAGTGQDRADVTVHGATNLTHTLATARRFVFRKGMPVYTREYDSEIMAKQVPADKEDPFDEPSWSDGNIKVWALPIKPVSSSSAKQSCQARAQSPRKRSLGEFQETIDQDQLDIEQRAKDQLMRQSVVSDMFNSSWKMDALVETPLAQVRMPAAMFVRNPVNKDIEPYKGPAPGDKAPLPDIKVLVRQPWPGAMVDKLPPTTPSKEAVSYIIRNHDIRGKFDAAKAKALKVRYGPDYAKLTRGEDVQSEDGQTITPDMVLGAPKLGKGIAVIDLPSPQYVEDLLNRPEWKSPAVTTELKVFVWILGPGVGDHPKLREFVAEMSHCEHTVSSTDYCPNYLALKSSAEASIRLARLKGDNYSIPVHDNITLPQVGLSTNASSMKTVSLEDLPFEPLTPGVVVDMEPSFRINKDEVFQILNTAKTLETIPRAVEQRMQVIRTRCRKPEFQKQLTEMRANLPGAEAEIIALGTGSSAPSKYRNVSATLLYAPGYGYYLLDCGENTLGQLQRVFEPEKLREVLRNLRMIWISHLHADHHLGTASLIKAWYRENYGADYKPSPQPETDLKKILQEKNRLFVVSEEMMIAWLEEYASVEDYGFDKIVPLIAHPEPRGNSIKTTFTYRHPRSGAAPYGRDSANRTVLDFNDNSSHLTYLLKEATRLDDLLTARVKHCKGALAVSMVFPDGFKVSYSGDCRPSDKFASIGRDSTVLIHEATFQDNMVGSALAKRHSTTGEALEVGRRMGARAVLLTHFSQRYQKIAHVDESGGTQNHDEVTSTRQAQAAAAREAGEADIPLDEPEENFSKLPSGAQLLDDIRFPSAGRPSLPASTRWIPGKNAPIATAMDYMRIKVGDLAYAQAYAPAIEKLVDLMERNSEQVAEATKKKAQAEEEARHAKKNKKSGKGKAAAAAAVVVVAPVVAETEEHQRSVFSASESESGWETSDYEE